EKCGVEFGVLNLQGRTFMNAIEDPFYAAASMVDQIRERTPLILVDFHAEATAEKMALGWELDGKVSLVIGTHTHIPTNDARILPKGTGYITDAGMSGPFDSVIGMQKKGAIRRFKSGLPQKFHVAKGDLRICGLSSEIDKKSGRCIHIEPVIYPPFEHYGGEMG
ncbi:MAG: TIGR00282 family metallophosphoesterase, partial [Balneolaceae bacterium]